MGWEPRVLKRSKGRADTSAKHWYQDKYQHVLVQRNVLALVALTALVVALIAVFTVAQLSPLKSVEPYLLQVDEKTGITQKVNPVSRADYAANEAIDRYFVAMYVRLRESYNPTIRLYNYNIVRVMSRSSVFEEYRRDANPSNKESLPARLGSYGQRIVNINSMSYIKNPPAFGQKDEVTPERIMQVRMTTSDSLPNSSDVNQRWVVTITFVYASLKLNESEQLLNPLGFIVTNYQIQREIQ
jgi:type IV secretion system protein VirB8